MIVDRSFLIDMSKTVASTTTQPTSDKWWIPIGVLVLLIPIVGVLGVALPPDAYSSLLIAPFSLLGGILTLLSPIFVYFDRKYLKEQSEWAPSGWYYWMILPPLTLVLPIIYVYQRHEQVGVP